MAKDKNAGGGDTPRPSIITDLKSPPQRLEFNPRGEEIKNQAGEIEGKMSIRAKISVGLLVVIILILPVVGMTLHYFTQMRKKVDTIARSDAKLINLANQIDENMLLAKRAESNFILLRDSLYVIRNQRATQKILQLCTEGKEIAISKQATLQGITEHTVRYQNSFATLVKRYQGSYPAEQIRALRQEFTAKFTETINRYNAMLTAAKKERVRARRDSLISEAGQYLRSFSIDDLTVSLQTRRNPEMTSLSQILSETSEKVRSFAKEFEQKSWRQVEQHRQESEMLVARAQRNIAVVLILTILVSIYLIFVLPSRIVKPISAITNIIKRVEKGDYDVTAKSASKDEVGQLALFLNRMMKQVKAYDTLKTEKIFTQQKKVEAIANAVSEGILLLNHEGEVTFMNRTLQEQLRWQRDIIGKSLNIADTKGELVKLVQEVLSKNVNTEKKHVLLHDADGKAAAFTAKIHLLRNNQVAIFAILILLYKEKKSLIGSKRS